MVSVWSVVVVSAFLGVQMFAVSVDTSIVNRKDIFLNEANAKSMLRPLSRSKRFVCDWFGAGCLNEECNEGCRIEELKEHGLTRELACEHMIKDSCIRRRCGSGTQCVITVSRDVHECATNTRVYYYSACQDKNECESNPCRNGGSCLNQNNRYQCLCRPGFTGVNCQTEINECASNPCEHGTCRDYVNFYVCNCEAGYTGNRCQLEIDECQSSPCLHSSTCVDKLNNFECICKAGYSGSRCETNIDECASNPCVHGECRDGVDGYTCVCHDGYAGPNCTIDIDECATFPCLNQGNCSDKVAGYTCSCQAGYTGSRCETDIDACVSNPCENNATCRDGVNNYVCECLEGHEGDHCQTETDECTSNPCKNGGNCTDKFNSYTCSCEPGYRGVNCEIDIDECSVMPCKHGAECFNQVNDYRCECGAGYTGKQCETEINECETNPCKNGSTCIDQVGSYHCDCRPGFQGMQCDKVIDMCASQPCQHNASCTGLLNNFDCDCRDGFTGKQCESEMLQCESLPCLNGGTCREELQSYTCDCMPGYQGQTCEIDIDECASNPCHNGAKCVDHINEYSCLCKPGYYGKHCYNTSDSVDRLPPQFTNCPSDMVISTTTTTKEVFWREPEVTDNSGLEISVTSTHKPGDTFSVNKPELVKYEAKDATGNIALCHFSVTLMKDTTECSMIPTPNNGQIKCTSAGESDMDCGIICTDPAKPSGTVPDKYTCRAGVWEPELNIADVITQACVNVVSPRSYSITFKTTIAGQCIPGEDFKDTVIKTILDILESENFCREGPNGNLKLCHEDQFVMECPATKRRKRQDATFDVFFTLDAYLGETSTIEEYHELIELVNDILDYFNNHQINITYNGKNYHSITMAMTDERTQCKDTQVKVENACANCQPGTHYDSTTNTCTVCPKGTYQEKEGQMRCEECSSGLTSPEGAFNKLQCKSDPHTSKSGPDSDTVTIILAVIGALILLVIIIVAVLITRRCRKNKQINEPNVQFTNDDYAAEGINTGDVSIAYNNQLYDNIFSKEGQNGVAAATTTNPNFGFQNSMYDNHQGAAACIQPDRVELPPAYDYDNKMALGIDNQAFQGPDVEPPYESIEELKKQIQEQFGSENATAGDVSSSEDESDDIKKVPLP